MPIPSIDISDATLDKIGNWTSRFLKSAVAIASFVGMAGFLGLIFITISPNPDSMPESETAEPDAIGILVPNGDKEVWITEIMVSRKFSNRCYERRTGVVVLCNSQGDGKLTVEQEPESGKDYTAFSCQSCESSFTGCGSEWNECNSTTRETCDCQLGCQTDVDRLYFCTQEKDVEGDNIKGGYSTLSGEAKTWAVLSNMGYLTFMLAIFLVEIKVERLKPILGVLLFWPVRCMLQLFTGVQLINASTVLEMTGGYVTQAFVSCMLFLG